MIIVKTDNKSLTQTEGKFSIQPLDRGYGITLGNAMRRVLLTSIPGAAVTHVKIEGVEHDGVADVQSLTIISNPLDLGGSLFGGIRMANSLFSGSNGIIGISAPNISVQNSSVLEVFYTNIIMQ